MSEYRDEVEKRIDACKDELREIDGLLNKLPEVADSP